MIRRLISFITGFLVCVPAWSMPVEIYRQKDVATNVTIMFYNTAGGECTDPLTLACTYDEYSDGAVAGAMATIAGTPTRIGTTERVNVPIAAAELNEDYTDIRCTSTCTDSVPRHFTISTKKRDSNVEAIEGHDLACTGTQCADGFESFLNVATPTGTLNSLPAAIPGSNTGLPTVNANNYVAGTVVVGTSAIGAGSFATGAWHGMMRQVSGISDSGSTTTIVDAARAEATVDYWRGLQVCMTDGPANYQCRTISAFNPTTDTITVDTPFTAAITTDGYIITPAESKLAIEEYDPPTHQELIDRSLLQANYFDANTDNVNVGTVNSVPQTGIDIGATLGALTVAASSGDPGTTTSIVAYLKQLINTLEGTAGIPVFPASAVPGNGVSMAEALRQVYDETAGLDGAVMRGTDGANTAVPPTAIAIRTEIDANGTRGAKLIAKDTAAAVGATSIDLAVAETFANDEIKGAVVTIDSATTGVGQSRCIATYSSTNNRATVAAWETLPTGTITYEVRSSLGGECPIVADANNRVPTKVEVWNNKDLSVNDPLPDIAPTSAGGLRDTLLIEGADATTQLTATAEAAIDTKLTMSVARDDIVAWCTVETTPFASTVTTFRCLPTDKSGSPITLATGKWVSKYMGVYEGAEIREMRYIRTTTWFSGDGQIQLETGRAWPSALADGVRVLIW